MIVTRNMRQAQRVSHQCAFFLAAQGQPGYIARIRPHRGHVRHPEDPCASDYVHGRCG